MYARMMEGCKKCASVKQLRQAAAVLQVQQRMLFARARFLWMQRAVVLIQRHMRGWFVRQ